MSADFERALLVGLHKDLKKLGFSSKMMSGLKTSNGVFCEFSRGYADKTLNYRDTYWCTDIQNKKLSVYGAKYEAWHQYLELQSEHNQAIRDYLDGKDF